MSTPADTSMTALGQKSTRIRRRIRIGGTVQGVGFRPFVYRLAQESGLTGLVRNDESGVYIEVEGAREAVTSFESHLTASPPPLASIDSVVTESIPIANDLHFSIEHTRRDHDAVTQISPDIAVCDDCLREMNDSSDRRFRYPFINCTNCGPRYTIIDKIPYDRPYTSMKIFPMCAACEKEYHDPSDRRFHAQPVSCPECGPRLWLRDGQGERISDNPIGDTIDCIVNGAVVAIRGLGGFHLAVDACNDDAVRRLRARKAREDKPLALLMPDLETARRFCAISDIEAGTLTNPRRPIVLLRKRLDGAQVAPSVAPDNNYLGVMLPYTPLHHLLFDGRVHALVMTSANISDEPIAIGNAEALARLAGIADLFLMHDREILQRCDDSIVRVTRGTPALIRRSRGYVPSPVPMPISIEPPVLACGADLKNTIALARERGAVLSQHIGDLDNPAALDFFRETIAHLQALLQFTPGMIACDLHPDYQSSRWARAQNRIPVIEVQHHHAHLASVMAENGVADPTIGIILDGTGYGLDGTTWGGEVLVGDFHSFDRHAWLTPVPMPGGDTAARQPWRMAVSYLAHSGFSLEDITALSPAWSIEPETVAHVVAMIERSVNTPLSSGCGRLFDAVAAILGICMQNTFEARAPIALEMAAGTDPLLQSEFASCSTSRNEGRGPVSCIDLIHDVVDGVRRRESTRRLARRFHVGLAEKVIACAISAAHTTGINRVALSGGVFQNRLLQEYVAGRLIDRNLEVLTHRLVPANDGGIALGQVAVANARYTSAEVT
ncbi:MAG: carbamoyltransferase HypF [candidate division Zixibacteria bacterium]|jgi:hydrogenase maturation protein HypF|nr:carbamoyltransferase HypF [candidate division Zixibacteria bacterium]